MKNMPGLTISIAMCTFNGERFLGAQLDSINGQHRPPDELVVCDDGSSDNTIGIVKEFARRSSFPTQLVINEKKLGSTKNFEKAISLCRGSIIALADQDDVWYPYKLGRIESVFAESTLTVAVFSDADLIDDETRPVGSLLWPTFSFDSEKQRQFANGDALNVLIRHPVVTGATMAFRRDMFEALASIPENEIHDRWISFLLAARGDFAIIVEPLMQYRRHEMQQVGPGPLTLREQIAQARRRGASAYFDEIERLLQLSERLGERKSNFPNSERTQRVIEKKISHLRHRAQLPRVKVARIPGIIWEIANGNYWRYSGGWRSLAKDLVIR
jgi:glycosyltransferase involved in cell wall biosynthesis